jgi:hypothetical protein
MKLERKSLSENADRVARVSVVMAVAYLKTL